MNIFTQENQAFQSFINTTETTRTNLLQYTKEEELKEITQLISNFKLKINDFYRENRKLNIGVIGQVKAGKSSFLNSLLFNGEEILPKASTPKTATLTKMEYSEKNIIQIEYYSTDEWGTIEDNAIIDSDDEIYTSARELVDMLRSCNIDPYPYLEKGKEEIEFSSYEDLISHLNDYVGEDGKFTPIVKSVILYLNKEEFKGLSIVDTPGLNDPIVSRTQRTKEFMEVCDVVFFLSQSGSFLDKSDWILLSSQLPQKGVKKLVLIASKYDSGIRDILRVSDDDDDIFGEDENTADNIPKACKIIKKKLTKRAKSKVQEFVRDLEMRERSPELIEVIKQCSKPIMISSMCFNMSHKSLSEFNSEEKNIYAALKQFSKNMESDLELLGNFSEVKEIFNQVVTEKEKILEEKSRSFIPNAREELRNYLSSYLEKTEKRIQILDENDRAQLLEQKQIMESKIGGIKADLAKVFGDLTIKVESEKAEAVREIRETGKDYLSIKDRTGTRTVEHSYTVSDAKLWNPFSWGKSHVEYSTHEEHYSYCIAADAIENLKKYAIDATNQVELVFTDAIQMKELKRKLLNVVVNNFDMGSEKYDSSLFRIMMERAIGNIEFPVFNIEFSDEMDSIAGKFTGELTKGDEKTALTQALSNSISRIYDGLCRKLLDTVQNFKKELLVINENLEKNLLNDMNQEFEELLQQCGNKEKEILNYKNYIAALEKEVSNLK